MASGLFYASVPPSPSVVGREGVARLPDGTSAYFEAPVAPFGSLAERTLVAEERLVPLPHGLDPALAVCFGVAGRAAWLALEWRAGLSRGETVLVLGASGPVGQIAVQAARLLGAGRVVAAARDRDGLRRAKELGADATVALGDDAGERSVEELAAALRDAAAGDLHVVVDPLWGEPAVAAIEAASSGARIVQLGQSAGAEAAIPSGALRGKALSILGYTSASAPAELKRSAYERMVAYAARGELTCDLERLPLDRVTEAWERQAVSPHRKLVLMP